MQRFCDSSKIGWWPPATSMMLNRVCPTATLSSTKVPKSSGPRWRIFSSIRRRRPSSTSPAIPAMPPMAFPGPPGRGRRDGRSCSRAPEPLQPLALRQGLARGRVYGTAGAVDHPRNRLPAGHRGAEQMRRVEDARLHGPRERLAVGPRIINVRRRDSLDAVEEVSCLVEEFISPRPDRLVLPWVRQSEECVADRALSNLARFDELLRPNMVVGLRIADYVNDVRADRHHCVDRGADVAFRLVHVQGQGVQPAPRFPVCGKRQVLESLDKLYFCKHLCQ